MTKDQLRNSVVNSFRSLVANDGYLFDCPIEEYSPCDARKLHEVCINHRLAIHLENKILPFKETLFVDIEFNREGVDFKNVMINGGDKLVRPDIVIHNRKTGYEKLNFLVVECKKQGTSQWEIEQDRQKIKSLMEDKRYDYSFGLHVVYGRAGVKGELFFKSDADIDSETLIVQPP